MNRKTVADLIRDGGDILAAAGVSDARHDARALMTALLQEQADSAILLGTREVTGAQAETFQALIARRARREPLQHILGQASIYELTVKSDARALIPRQDSAEVIALALACLAGAKVQTPLIADLGTGSGVLLAECLHRYKHAHGIAVERSARALSLATENFDRVGLSHRTELFEGSWSVWDRWADCDLIISNPPYIRSDIIPTLQPEVREYDPIPALDGGEDGLDAYREIIGLAATEMKLGAFLVFEIGFDQKQAVSQLLLKAGFTDLRHQKDIEGQDRAVAATKS